MLKHLRICIALLSIYHVSAMAADKSIDRRTFSAIDGSAYYIVLCARAGSATGHAFVVWGVEDGGRAVSAQAAYGFYPAKGGSGVFGSVPGEIRNEALSPKTVLLSHRLIVRVDREQYLRSQRAYGRWATRTYNLYESNCVAFVADVSRTIGLTVPDSTSLRRPATFVADLIERN